jgi:hypothetical protein
MNCATYDNLDALIVRPSFQQELFEVVESSLVAHALTHLLNNA